LAWGWLTAWLATLLAAWLAGLPGDLAGLCCSGFQGLFVEGPCWSACLLLLLLLLQLWLFPPSPWLLYQWLSGHWLVGQGVVWESIKWLTGHLAGWCLLLSPSPWLWDQWLHCHWSLVQGVVGETIEGLAGHLAGWLSSSLCPPRLLLALLQHYWLVVFVPGHQLVPFGPPPFGFGFVGLAGWGLLPCPAGWLASCQLQLCQGGPGCADAAAWIYQPCRVFSRVPLGSGSRSPRVLVMMTLATLLCLNSPREFIREP
jgi:hypothetical protein